MSDILPVGDRAQRYMVIAERVGDVRMIIGWTSDPEGGGLASSWVKHPDCRRLFIFDRDTGVETRAMLGVAHGDGPETDIARFDRIADEIANHAFRLEIEYARNELAWRASIFRVESHSATMREHLTVASMSGRRAADAVRECVNDFEDLSKLPIGRRPW